jgi:hypothetical protein
MHLPFLLAYLLKVTLVSACLFSYYCLFLRNAAFHPYNRWYLLASSAAALLLPLVPLPAGWPAPGNVLVTTLLQPATEPSGSPAAAPPSQASSGGWPILPIIYALVTAFFLFRVLLSLLRIGRLTLKYPRTRLAGVSFYETDEPGTPFSFGNRLFWSRDLALDTENGQAILRHELAHIHGRHTLDILTLEILRALFWINPIFYLTLLEMRLIHEFLADRSALDTGGDRRQYAECLLWLSAGAPANLRLTHSFFHKHLKRRITMIIQTRPTPRYLSRVLALPLLLLLFSACAKKVTTQSPGDNNPLGMYLIHHIRYPNDAIAASMEGTIWFSIKLDNDGKMLNFETFPSEAAMDRVMDHKLLAIWVKSKPFPDPSRSVTASKETIFFGEVKKATDQIADTKNKGIKAGTYFVRMSFAIEQPKSSDQAR